jgi:phosphoglycolate phosphatase
VLYLFDIDGTLVDTGGAGIRALEEASVEVFGGAGPDLDLAGATDLGVVATIHAHFGRELTPELAQAYFEVYLRRLEWNLSHGGFPGRVIEGVPECLSALSSRPGVTLGLLTGNTAGGAALKMKHFGLDPYFGFGAYGCDHADRNLLGPIALQRAAAHAGRTFTAGETWVIGDTPKDIACAHAAGARCLAVATGRFTERQLAAAGADKVVPSLDLALEWL